jgi:hydrogenase small subunit
MAITRRQFVATLGSMAAALGISQVDLAKVTEAFAAGGIWAGGKPKVIWVHGAECTGCSTSLLGLFEDAAEEALVPANGTKVIDALGLITGGAVPRTLNSIGANFDTNANSAATAVNIADILIDFIDLQYHETVMGPGGDLAYQWLYDNMQHNTTPFVMVVEGGVQVFAGGGAWNKPGVRGTDAPWCSVGMDANASGITSGNYGELSFDEVVTALAVQPVCMAIIGIGQCATFGGYPACVSPDAQFAGKSQTPSYGVFDFLASHAGLTTTAAAEASGKVINVPGCPANPWWFVLTVVLWLVDAVNGPGKSASPSAGPLGILGAPATGPDGHAIWPAKASAIDYGRRLKAVYPAPIHGGACPRYNFYKAGQFAAKPGDTGCLMKLGCKGLSTRSLCPFHGWNGQQPTNPQTWDYSIAAVQGTKRGGFCVSGGSPCMGCTEKGYPDAQVPFVKLF